MPAFPKQPVVRAPAYRQWVASLPCCACRIEGYSQAAHPNAARYGKGMARKADDLTCFPLCCTRPGHMGHHAMHDLCLDMTKDERDELEAGYIAETQALAREAGRPEFKEAA